MLILKVMHAIFFTTSVITKENLKKAVLEQVSQNMFPISHWSSKPIAPPQTHIIGWACCKDMLDWIFA